MQRPKAEIHDQTDQITELLNSGKPEDEKKARQLTMKQNALNLKLMGLRDLHLEKDKKVRYFNAEGQTHHADGTTISRQEAMFVVPFLKKIVKKDNKYYLIAANEELTPANERDGEASFKKSKSELMSFTAAIQHTIKSEKEFHVGRMTLAIEARKNQPNYKIEYYNSTDLTEVSPSHIISSQYPRIRPRIMGKLSTPEPVLAFAKRYEKDLLDQLDTPRKNIDKIDKEIKRVLKKQKKLRAISSEC